MLKMCHVVCHVAIHYPANDTHALNHVIHRLAMMDRAAYLATCQKWIVDMHVQNLVTMGHVLELPAKQW